MLVNVGDEHDLAQKLFNLSFLKCFLSRIPDNLAALAQRYQANLLKQPTCNENPMIMCRAAYELVRLCMGWLRCRIRHHSRIPDPVVVVALQNNFVSKVALQFGKHVSDGESLERRRSVNCNFKG